METGVYVVLGAQWGDEGKGKIVDILASKYPLTARSAGGANAGHTVVVDGIQYKFHLLPSGLLSRSSYALIGNGVVIHLPSVITEAANLSSLGVDCLSRVLISDRAHLAFDFHMVADKVNELERAGNKIGTTGKGIGPCYAAKANRIGVRVGDLRDFRGFRRKMVTALAAEHKRFYPFEYDVRKQVEKYYELAKQFEPNVTDSVEYVNRSIDAGHGILIEGANAALLDLDFGTYPFVTSSNCSIGGICTGLGLAPKRISRICGVVKAYLTRVGEGPFPTEQLNDIGTTLQATGHEFGSTTGRPRRCGWLDVLMLDYTTKINGYDEICLTKLDVLSDFDTILVGVGYTLDGRRLTCYPQDLGTLARVEVVYESFEGWKAHAEQVLAARKFEDLPEKAREYVLAVEKMIGVPIRFIGVGPGRDSVVVRDVPL
mmetsp:Transcript_6190/g.15042  ORF Transcript_6190/g.15042 Transcript_6190/m.15042 type:complete len:430 (+) Transcript_6190:90-1379(+)